MTPRVSREVYSKEPEESPCFLDTLVEQLLAFIGMQWEAS